MATQDDVRRIALSLPETSEDPNFFRFFVKGRRFAWSWPERADARKARVPNRDVIVVRVANEVEKQSQLTLDPEKIFTESHYNGYPAALVRLSKVENDLLEDLLTDAWRCRAPKRLAAQLDDPLERARMARMRWD